MDRKRQRPGSYGVRGAIDLAWQHVEGAIDPARRQHVKGAIDLAWQRAAPTESERARQSLCPGYFVAVAVAVAVGFEDADGLTLDFVFVPGAAVAVADGVAEGVAVGGCDSGE